MTKNTLESQFFKLLGEQLTFARRKKDLTLKEVSQHLNKSKQTIDYYESGKCKISQVDFEKMCKIYDLQGNINIDVKIE